MFHGLCHNQAEVAVKTIVQLCATEQRLRGGTVGGCHAGPISKQGMKENDTRAASEAQLPADAATRKKDDGVCSRVGACHLLLLAKCGTCWRARASTHAGVANVQLKDWRCWTSARSFIRLHSSNRHDHPATRDNTSDFEQLDSGRHAGRKFEVANTLSADLETRKRCYARWQQIVLDGDVAVSR